MEYRNINLCSNLDIKEPENQSHIVILNATLEMFPDLESITPQEEERMLLLNDAANLISLFKKMAI